MFNELLLEADYVHAVVVIGLDVDGLICSEVGEYEMREVSIRVEDK